MLTALSRTQLRISTYYLKQIDTFDVRDITNLWVVSVTHFPFFKLKMKIANFYHIFNFHFHFRKLCTLYDVNHPAQNHDTSFAYINTINCISKVSIEKILHSPNGPVTLGSDYRTILKSDPILLILKSELDVPILKIYKFAVTLLRLLRFIGTDFIARKMCQWIVLRWSYDDRTMIASQKHCLATFQKSALICEQDRKPVTTFEKSDPILYLA